MHEVDAPRCLEREGSQMSIPGFENLAGMALPLLTLVEQWGSASVRLQNSIREAHHSGTLPFPTVGEFVAAGIEAHEALLRIPRLGRKTANELADIIRQFIDDGCLDSSPNLSAHADSPKIAHELQLTLLEFIESCEVVSVRLRNAIVAATGDETCPFSSVQQYVQAGKRGTTILRRIPNLGAESAAEFAVLVADFLGVGSGDMVPPEFDMSLDGRYPDLGHLLTVVMRDLSFNQKTVANGRLGRHETLEATGRSLGSTREGVRQIEAKIHRSIASPLRKLITHSATVLRQCLQADAVHEISVDDLARLCKCTREEFNVYLGFLKWVNPAGYTQLHKADQDIYFPRTSLLRISGIKKFILH